MTNENREGFEIDVQKLLLAYLSRWWIFVLCAVLAASIAAYITHNHITPMYRASVTIYVNNAARDQKVNYITNSNLETAQRLVSTYIYIIESDTVLEKVADAANLGMSAARLRSCLTAAQKGETELFTVSITHADPQMAARIANAVAEVAPGEIENFVEGSSTKIIDYAKVPGGPSSPNMSKNVMLGTISGFLLALIWITILFLMDVRVKDEEDLNAIFDVPVLGQIPAFLPEGSKGRGSYEAKNAYASKEKGGNR